MITFKYKLAAAILFLLSATTMHTCFASWSRGPASKKEKTSKSRKDQKPVKMARSSFIGERVVEVVSTMVSPKEQKDPPAGTCCIL